MKEGDWVKIVKQSTNMNSHIKNVGYVGRIDDMNDFAVQIKCINGGFGAVDIDCVVPHTPTKSEKLDYSTWWFYE